MPRLSPRAGCQRRTRTPACRSLPPPCTQTPGKGLKKALASSLPTPEASVFSYILTQKRVVEIRTLARLMTRAWGKGVPFKVALEFETTRFIAM